MQPAECAEVRRRGRRGRRASFATVAEVVTHHGGGYRKPLVDSEARPWSSQAFPRSQPAFYCRKRAEQGTVMVGSTVGEALGCSFSIRPNWGCEQTS